MEDFGMLVSDIIYSELFYKSAINLTKNNHDAKDLIQETALKALRFENQFLGGSLYGWLYTILKNNFINKIRYHYYHKIVLFENPELLIDDWIEPEIVRNEKEKSQNSDMERMLNGIQKLHPINRNPISLFLDGYKIREIAEMEGVPTGTIKSRMFTGKKELKKLNKP